MVKNNHGLGRIHKPDERDKNFLIRSILPKEIPITRKYWYANGWWGNQLNTPMCVGYSWAHWVEDGPIGHPGAAPVIPPRIIYDEAQKLDEWEGNDYDGTSVRAGAKYLQSLGYIKEYRWAWDVQTLVDALLTLGPVVIGINWYNNMFEPNRDAIIKIGGGIAGGHAILVDGVSKTKQLFRLKNSWGRDWGNNGFAYISFDDMERLISEDGEVAIAVEAEPSTEPNV